MRQTGKEQPVLKKAYEISYAVFRIASRVTSPAMKEHLERQGLSLLDAAAVENFPWVGTVSRVIEYLIRFGSDVGVVHAANAETIIMELDALNVAIAGLEKPATLGPVQLDDIFGGQERLFSMANKSTVRNDNPAIAENPASRVNPAIEIGIRQSAILDRIRQSGNCRLKDIQEILPELSERTIRYELQSLIERDLVERVGAGGPSVFYRIRQVA